MGSFSIFTDISGMKIQGPKLTFGRGDKIFITLLVLSICFATGRCADCLLPQAWNGRWFITEFANGPPIIINSTSNSILRHTQSDDKDALDTCVWMHGDFYIFKFKNAKSNCYRCILLSERHGNVLYSKEPLDFECFSERDREWDPDKLCEHVSVDGNENSYFWFRIDYQAVNCPLGNSSFQFSYVKDKKCEKPISRSSSCLNSTKLEFRYEACPDNEKSVAKSVHLTCTATWEESGHGYFVADVKNIRYSTNGQLQDRFRCFVYSKKTSPNPMPGKSPLITGYDIGTLNSATCTGLHDIESAEMALYLKKENPIDTEEKPCSYPSWFASHGWIDMNKSIKLDFHPQLNNISTHVRLLKPYPVLSDTPHVLQESSLFCLLKANTSGKANWNGTQVAVVAKKTEGCKIEEICWHIVQRSEYIVQVYVLENMNMERQEFRARCLNSSYADLQKKFTLISTHGTSKKCEFPGRYNASHHTMDSDRNFPPMNLGCAHKNTDNEQELDFSCMDGWTEGNSTFTLISSNRNKNELLYCMLERKDDTKPHSVFVTGQDCIGVPKRVEEILQDDRSDSLSNSHTFISKIFNRTAYCNSTLVDQSIASLDQKERETIPINDLNSGSLSSSSKLKPKPVFVMTISVIILVFTIMVNYV